MEKERGGKMYKYKLGFIGLGNMGSAILNGILQKHILQSKEIIAFDVSTERIKSAPVSKTKDIAGILKNAHFIIFCFKPQDLPDVAMTLKKNNLFFKKNQVVISILAGIPTSKLRKQIPGVYSLTRVMPNLALQAGNGVSALFFDGVEKKDAAFVKNIFSAAGISFETKEELLDVVTGISGSGPAYVFYFIEAMMEAAIENGIDAGIAKKMSLGTFSGALKLAEDSDISIQDLRKKVTSKGGTTERALNFFEENRLKQIIKHGISAAITRSGELGEN